MDNLYREMNPKLEEKEQTYLTIFVIKFRLKAILAIQDKKVRKLKGKDLKKWCKHLLSLPQNRTNLLLWGNYADMEWQLDRVSDSKKAFGTLLSMHGLNICEMSDKYQQLQSLRVYKLYVSFLLGINCDTIVYETKIREISSERKDLAVKLLCTIVDNSFENVSKINGLQILSALSKYKNISDAMLNEIEEYMCVEKESEVGSSVLLELHFEGNLVSHWIWCYAVLDYLVNSTKQTSKIYGNVIKTVQNCQQSINQHENYINWNYIDKVLESLTKEHLELLCFNRRSHICSLRDLRQPLQNAAMLFPDSKPIVSAFAKVILSANIAGLLWKDLTEVLNKAKTSSLWQSIICEELERKKRMVQYLDEGQKLFKDSSGNCDN